MATPLGHALAGYAISFFAKEGEQQVRRQLLPICVFMAVAPDLDIIPGLLQGKPILYHSGISHSFFVGLALSLIIAFGSIFDFKAIRLKPQKGVFFWILGLAFVAYASHLVLDYFGPDGREPYGIPLFWPLSSETFLSPVPLLLGARHVSNTSASLVEFIRGVLSLYNVAAIGLEIGLVAPLIILGKWRRGRQSVSDQLSA
jgi:membrane-bound metal-dependent hydrolase YbcI (DUF457 family)